MEILKQTFLKDADKWGEAILAGLLMAVWQAYGLVIILVGVVIVFDVLTGLLKAFATDERLNAAKASKGFTKKLALLLGLAFGIFLDVAVPVMLSVISVELPFNSPFGMIVGVYIILNEGISICENLYTVDPKILPAFIRQMHQSGKEELDKEDKEHV